MLNGLNLLHRSAFPRAALLGARRGCFLVFSPTSQAIDARDAAGFGIRKLSVLDVDGLHEAPDPVVRWGSPDMAFGCYNGSFVGLLICEGPGMHRLGRSYGTYKFRLLISLDGELLVLTLFCFTQTRFVKASRSSTTLRGESVITLSMFPSCRQCRCT